MQWRGQRYGNKEGWPLQSTEEKTGELAPACDHLREVFEVQCEVGGLAERFSTGLGVLWVLRQVHLSAQAIGGP